jgi:hypothetical protein
MRATLWSQAFARKCFGLETAIAGAKREDCKKTPPSMRGSPEEMEPAATRLYFRLRCDTNL